MDSPLRRRAPDTPVVTADDQFLIDNQQAFPITRSLLRGLSADDAGRARADILKAQVSGDQQAENNARFDLARAQKRLQLPVTGPQTFDEASASGDYGNYLQNVLGNAASSFVKPVAGAVLGRLLGPVGSFAGAAGGSFSAIRNAEVNNFAGDPELAQLPPEEQLSRTRNSALLQAGPEALLPTAFGAGNRLVKAVNRAPRVVRRLADLAVEAGTETVQDAISQQVAHPERPFDVGSLKENAIQGAIGGGALGALIGGGEDAPRGPGIPLPGAAPSPAPSPTPGADPVADTLARASVAASTAQTPQDFVQQTFGDSADEAAADLRPDTEDPSVLGAVDVGAAIQQRAVDSQQRAARFAEELLSSPTTPDAVRSQIEGYNGDFSSPEARAFVARNLVAQKAGAKLSAAVTDVFNFFKSLGSKEEPGAVAKSNLQDIPLIALQPLVQQLAQRLGPNAADAPVLARQLVAVANRLSLNSSLAQRSTERFGSDTADVPALAQQLVAAADRLPSGQLISAETKRRLDNLSEVVDDDLLRTVEQVSGTPGLAEAIARIRAIPSAFSDVTTAEGSSFLESLLAAPLPEGTIRNVAKYVDQIGVQIQNANPTRVKNLLAPLRAVFGSVRNAQTVVEFYGNLRREALQQDAESNPSDAQPSSAPDAPIEAEATAKGNDLTVTEPARLRAKFKAPNPNRPFVRGVDKAPADAQTMSLREFISQSDEAPAIVLANVRQDLRRRLQEEESRDTKTVQEAIRGIEAIPEDQRDADTAKLLASLKARKTEDRPNLPKLRKQLRKIDTFIDSANREVDRLSDKLRVARNVKPRNFSQFFNAVSVGTRQLRASLKAHKSGARPGLPKLRDRLVKINESVSAARRKFNELSAALRDAESKKHIPLPNAQDKSTEKALSQFFTTVAARINKLMASKHPNRERLRSQLKSIDRAVGVAERDFRILNDRLQNAKSKSRPALQKALDRASARRDERIEKVLDQFFVTVTADTDAVNGGEDLGASDTQVAKFRELLDRRKALPARKKNETGNSFAQRQEKVKADNAAITKTRIAFRMKGQKNPLFLSAESMVHNSSIRGTVAQRLAQSISDVLARDDVEGLVEPSPDTIVLRRKDAPPLTYGDIAPKRPVAKPKATGAERQALAAKLAKKRESSQEFKDRRRAAADRLETQIALSGLGNKPEKLLGFLVKKALSLQANLERLKASTAPTGSLQFGIRANLSAYENKIRSVLEEMFPFPTDDEISEAKDRASDLDTEEGVEPAGDIEGGNILEAEARLDALGERLRLLQSLLGKGKTLGLVDSLKKDIQLIEQTADRAAESVPLNKRVQDVPGRREAVPGQQSKPKTLTAKVVSALHDVAVKENFSRLKTPDQVLQYAALGRALVNQLSQVAEVNLTDEQNQLLSKLKADFDQTKNAAFDWDSLFDGLSPTAGQKARLKDIVASMQPGAQRAFSKGTSAPNLLKSVDEDGEGAKASQQTPNSDASPLSFDDKLKIAKEIHRTRGDDVRVIFTRFAKIDASGKFTLDRETGERIIQIAVEAANPTGVGRHEALHDFFAMLDTIPEGRSVKRDLVAAASSPNVRRQLRKLLADHPKALEQVNTSAEERVAYAYQFWAEGLLQLRPAKETLFERVKAFLRDLFNVVSTDRRAELLLTALQDGKFANPSVVSEVLADIKGERFQNKMDRLAPALTKAVQAVFTVGPDRLRAFQNDSLSALADRFEKSFIPNRSRQQGIWENRLAGILDGTTALERRTALDNMQAMREPASDLEKKLASFFKDSFEYMRGAGVGRTDPKTKSFVFIREVERYFPRVFDREAILRDKAKFTSLVRKYSTLNQGEAEALANAVIHGKGSLDLAENEHALGFTPFARAVIDRKLTFITPDNAAEFAAFQIKDLADITKTYVVQMTHRAEYAREFGNDGEDISSHILESGVKREKDIAEIGRIVQGLEGTLGTDMSQSTKDLMSAALTLQNLVILPLSIASQMIDPIILAARTGSIRDAGNAYMTAITRFLGGEVEGEELAKMLGIISNDTVLEAMGVAHGAVNMSARMQNINRVFFKYNGMQSWNSSMRIAATVAGERYLLAHKNDAEALEEVGLTKDDIKVDTNGRLDVADPKVQLAMFRFVDQAVLRPSAANRPIWMSDPRFLLVAHLKQFTFAMQNVVLKRASKELGDGNPKPWAILTAAMPVMLAADMAKFALTGAAPATWGYMDYLTHAVSRSGLLGLGDFATQAMHGTRFGEEPGVALLGPTFEHLSLLLRWIGGDPAANLGKVIDRTIPGARFF